MNQDRLKGLLGVFVCWGGDLMGHIPVGMMLRLNSRKKTVWKMCCSRVELDLGCAIVVLV